MLRADDDIGNRIQTPGCRCQTHDSATAVIGGLSESPHKPGSPGSQVARVHDLDTRGLARGARRSSG